MSSNNDADAAAPLLGSVTDTSHAIEVNVSSPSSPKKQATAPSSPSGKKSPEPSPSFISIAVNEPAATTTVAAPCNLLGICAKSPKSPKSAPKPVVTTIGHPTLSNEYRFVHQRIPPREGKKRFLLPLLLLGFQVVFIILFAFFGNYAAKKPSSDNTYPLFEDLHAITLLGFGFLMTFLKRYGYSSLGFNLLLVAFVVQWAMIIRGWAEWRTEGTASFQIGIENLVFADFTAIAVLISFGALLGKTTLAQLVVLALIEVLFQVGNEYLNVYVFKAYDVGRSMYVHLFGAVFGLVASKALHIKGIQSAKQASVYHSDLFSFIGTLFLWVYYPSFNGLLANQTVPLGQQRAIVNTYAAIAASCVFTFGISSLAGKGKINPMHIQHATIAGGIAIGSVADLNVQIYVALIVGAVAGLLSTLSYQYVNPLFSRALKLHDTCGVYSLHVIPGVIAGLVSAIFALASTKDEYKEDLYAYYPARRDTFPTINITQTVTESLAAAEPIIVEDNDGRSALCQAAMQLAALAVTIGIALVGGLLTGLLLRVPIFEQLSEDVEMFDDESQWVTPDDYALKLTFASSSQDDEKATTPLVSTADDKKDDTKV